MEDAQALAGERAGAKAEQGESRSLLRAPFIRSHRPSQSIRDADGARVIM